MIHPTDTPGEPLPGDALRRSDYFTASLPGIGGALKVAPEDFVVDEIPAYAPSGSGQHLLLRVEKRGLTTQEMIRRLATLLDVAAGDIGVAGQKDRQAVTRQLVSVPAHGLPSEALAGRTGDGFTVLEAALHHNKLRTGHLRGNRFIITVRGVAADAAIKAQAILAALAKRGLPNRFGAQRFGRHGDNARQGRALLDGKLTVRDRFRRRLYISAYQALLFNRYLERRHADGSLGQVLDGDVMQRTSSGGLFVARDDELPATQARFDQREIVPTGPIFGHDMFAPPAGSDAALREQAVLDEEGVTLQTFASGGRLAEGTRRPLLVPLEDVTVTGQDDHVALGFCLPAGAYATVVLEEVMKPTTPLQVLEDEG